MKKRSTALATASLLLALLSFTVMKDEHNQQTKDNTLTTQEKEQGWILLFDGKTTDSWRPYKINSTDGWEIVDGTIHNKDKATGVQHPADLITKDEYGDFEFVFDWKIGKAANSGVMYRVVEGKGATYETGPEYQLIDDNGYPHRLEASQYSGSDYAMHPPSKQTAKPAGEWNTTKIVVHGAHVEHWLNGEKVVDFELWTPEWQALKEKSKWKDAKDYGMAKKGHLALQDHGGGIWFKNLKVRKL